MTARRIIMVAGEGESTRIVYHWLNRAVGVHKVILEAPVSTKLLLERRVQKLGMRTVVGQILFKGLIDRPLKRRSVARRRAIKNRFDLEDRAIPERDLIRVSSINAPEALEHLQSLSPSVVVVNGTRIIAKRVLESIRAPFINMHAGITPLYRGVHGGYWALAQEDRAHCGVTVHLVDPGIDTGGILGQARIDPTSDDNFATYPLLQVAAGLPLLVDAVRAALESELKLIPAPVGSSRLWSHPTFAEYVHARFRSGVK